MLMQRRKKLVSLCSAAGRKKKCAGEKKPCKTYVIKGKWLGQWDKRERQAIAWKENWPWACVVLLIWAKKPTEVGFNLGLNGSK